MATTFDTALASWIRTEHEKVEALSARLREAVAVVPRIPSSDWLTQLRDRFEHFRAHMHQHMALEEHNGYMKPVVERFPALVPKVERLGHEHREIAVLLDELHHTLAKLTPQSRLLVRDCCHRIGTILNYVDHHEDEENELVEFAFTNDIGTKD